MNLPTSCSRQLRMNGSLFLQSFFGSNEILVASNLCAGAMMNRHQTTTDLLSYGAKCSSKEFGTSTNTLQGYAASSRLCSVV